MGIVRNLACLIFMIAGYLVGSAGCFFGWQIQQIARVAQPQPVAVSLADLAAQTPTNHLIELTGFRFGAPLIDVDKKDQHWTRVSIPLEAKGRPTKRLIVFQTTAIQDQAQLDALLAQESLPAFVADGLSKGSLFSGRFGGAFAKANPKLKEDAVLFLTAPDLAAFGATWGPESLLAPQSLVVVWLVTMIAFFLAAIGFVAIDRSTPTRVKQAGVFGDAGREDGTAVSCIPPGAVPAEQIERNRERLAVEVGRSVHPYNRFAFLGRLAGRFGVAGMLLLVALLFFTVTRNLLDKGEFAGVSFGWLVTWACVVPALVIVKRALMGGSHGVSEVQVCPSGLRLLRHGRQMHLTWAEIPRIERTWASQADNKHMAAAAALGGLIGALIASQFSSQRRRTSDCLRIELDEEVLTFDPQTLEDYHHFCDSLAAYHGEEAALLQRDRTPIFMGPAGAAPKKDKSQHLTDPRSPYYEGA
jgi:hypothetical protein